MRAVALADQRGLRDLQSLPRLVDEVEWLEMEEARDSRWPLVLCALLASDNSAVFQELVQERLAKGKGVLLVPRFSPVALGQLIGTSEAIDIKVAEFKEVQWADERFRVPGSVVFRSSLHAGRLAFLEGIGAQLLAYRPSTARGTIIISGASLTSNRPGVDPHDQRRLLWILLDRLQEIKNQDETKLVDDSQPPQNFLRLNQELGAAVLLAVLAGASYKPEEVTDRVKKLGMAVNEEKVVNLLNELKPDLDLAEIRELLIQEGWSPFVRRIEQMKRDGWE